ncbi:T9SS type A sorting domain-containing protein [Bergeyella sp. RCAD1439]|uniref:T9SS type A sorting domain-containing protein n=1 Tax=Bergeyella anatis TaxID=3113737 RepID=UPI002E18FAEE|nr:T9SS type A sorting domain-containing protein [Bergeyella sp. RCAD1439]
MRKFLPVTLMAVQSLCAQNVIFEDVNFKTALLAAYPSYDVNKDKEISEEEALMFTTIRNLRSYPAITSAKGIEAFKNLTELNLGRHSLTSIDVSENTKLKILNLRDNRLTGVLDLSGLNELSNLELNNNNLTGVELPASGTIVFLYLNNNQIESIDLSKQKAVKRFFMVKNKVSSLDLSPMTALERLHIEGNALREVDLSGLGALSWVSVVDNKIEKITFGGNEALKTLLANKNNLKTLDLRDAKPTVFSVINVSDNPDFTEILLDCEDKVNMVSPSGTRVTNDCASLSVREVREVLGYVGPNPATDELIFKGFTSSIEMVQIFDAQGRLIQESQLSDEPRLRLEPSVRSGLLLVRVKTSRGEQIFKIMKK